MYKTAIGSNGAGGALSGLSTNFTIVSCLFVGNSATQNGGALETTGFMSMLQIFNSQNYIVGDGDKNNYGTVFINNSAGNGGAVFSSARSLIINATILAANNMAARAQ